MVWMTVGRSGQRDLATVATIKLTMRKVLRTLG